MFRVVASLVLFVLFIYYLITRIVPQVLRWIILRCYHVEARIGRIGIPYLTLHDVQLSVRGFTILMNQIGFRSRFLSSEVSKMVCVEVHDMRINKDVTTDTSHPLAGSSLSHLHIPPLLINIAQFVSVRVGSVTWAVVVRGESVVHSTVSSVQLEASVVHSARSLLVTAGLASTSTRLLRHAAGQPSLLHVQATLSIDATLIADTPLSIQNISISLSNVKTAVNEGFFSYFCWMERKLKTKAPAEPATIDHNELLDYIAPIVPKKLSVRVEECVLTDELDQELTSLHKLYLDSTFTHLPHKTSGMKANGSVQFMLFDLKVESQQETLLSLNRFTIEASLAEERVTAKLNLNTFTSLVNDKNLVWLINFLLPQVEGRGGRGWWPAGLQAEVRLSLVDVSSSLLVPHLPPAHLGFNHLKLSYDSTPMINHGVFELLLESGWWVVSGHGGGGLRKEHRWGCSVYCGCLLVKGGGGEPASTPVSRPGPTTWPNPHLDAMVEVLRLEWSPPLALLLSTLITSLPMTLFQDKGKKKKKTKPALSLNLSLSNINLFFIAEKKVCLMTRIDWGKVESSGQPGEVSVVAQGTKICSITPTSKSFICHKSDDIKNWYGYFETIRLERKQEQRLMRLKFSKQINFVWSANFHLKVKEVAGELVKLKEEWSQSGRLEGEQREASRHEALHISLVGQLKAVIKLSKLHFITLHADDFSYSRSAKECVWASTLLKIAVDSAEIFMLEVLHFTTLSDNESVREERATSEGFTLPWNRTWSISMRSIRAVFPYEHEFCVAVQDELISIFKWVKKMHNGSKRNDSKLPPDLLIKVKEFLFEISDDPFEVRLRDNYELLVDEHKESLMRQKKLDQKVSEMCKTHLLIPSGKLTELYTNLMRVNAQIYVQRSRQILAAGARTRLLACLAGEVSVLALADPSLHGPVNLLRNMTAIDPTSPWPEEGLEFVTWWCRNIVVKCADLKLQLRDFPQPWVDMSGLNLWGRLVGAEQAPTRRAIRTVRLELGEPWGSVDVERSLTSLKFYHDFNMEVQHFSYAFGPCWEPVIAQCNIGFEKIVRPSVDPSQALPLWDKLRLVVHGRVTAVVRQMTVLLHASLDPYNTTEEMEITWTSLALDWTNGKIIFKGDVDIFVRTASKYDDCRLVHVPNLRLSVKLGWHCLGDPCDHHSVMPCAPDRLPDYSSNQEHDSFRAFRSQNLNISLALETKPVVGPSLTEQDSPVALLYGSTLRWFESLKLILSGVTRPTRRGAVFEGLVPRPRRLPLSRHYRKVHLLLSLHSFQLHYWMSFAMQRGFELTADAISFSSEHMLSLVGVSDGLVHRLRADWTVVYMTCELHNAEIWLRSALPHDASQQEEEVRCSRPPVEKCYFLSVGKVSYGREGTGPPASAQPIHRLVVYGLKAAWTMSNRDVVLALYDTFIKTKQLKKNLCVEALKGFRGETGNTSVRCPDNPGPGQALPPSTAPPLQASPSPLSKVQCGVAATMLQQLIAEVDTKAVVFSDEPTTEPSEQPLQGLAACHLSDDIAFHNWSIALVNSQMLLKGPETVGYVIISAAKAEIVQRVHRPVWRDMTLVNKTTWVGSLQSVQYYATVNADQTHFLHENIMWLSVDNIKEKDDCIICGLDEVPQLVGSGQSVGGVVSETVGASSPHTHHSPLQLQRIVSRCTCEFFYASYGECSVGCLVEAVSAPPPEEPSLWEASHPPIDAFTLMHHNLEVCTNSLQYGMLLDIVNNLLLYVDVERKERYERLQRMRFQLQLQSVEDQRRPILDAQTRVRALLSQLRRLEKETYLVQRALQDEPTSAHLAHQIDSLDRQVNACKESVSVQSEELAMMLSCYKETQLMADQKLAALRAGDNALSIVRANEICFKHAQWRLTELDGQLGIADLKLSNFVYTKNSKSDDSVEHLLEIGYVRMTNLLPNQIYKQVLHPTEIHNMPVDRKRAIRVFCREKAPVGGISIMEHFEINVVPLTIELTKKFYQTMLKFCFPEREAEETDLTEETDKKGHSQTRGKETNFYVPIERKEDVEKMKERAEKNKLFIYIKIPEVPVKVSYKGNKEKNLSDLRDLSLVIPTLEYHNVTWTWLDLLLAMKTDSKSVILSQAIKHKLQIKSMRRGNEDGFPLDEDKARILLGSRHLPGESKSNLKRSIFKFPK